MVVTGLINSYRATGAIQFVSVEVVLLAVAELFVPILDDAVGRHKRLLQEAKEKRCVVTRVLCILMAREGSAEIPWRRI